MIWTYVFNVIIMKKVYNFLFPVALGLLIFFLPKPIDIEQRGWSLFALFVGTIVALITKPIPMGGVSLISLTIAMVFGILDVQQQALVGFSSSISWLIVVVFVISRGFIKTKLGDRLAYFFVKLFGKTTLGLGYSLVLTEMLIAPFMPSSIARAGGIIYPMIKSLSKSVANTHNGHTEGSIGAFLVTVCYQANIISSAVFLTAMAANPIIQSMLGGYGINIDWTTWFLAASLPGFMSVILVPLFIYIIYPPKLKDMSHVKILATKELQSMGSISKDEWIMMFVFGIMLILWVFGGSIGVDTTVTGFIGLSMLLILGVLTFDDVLSEKEAWHTLLWFSILMVLAQNLQTYGVIKWFSEILSSNIAHLPWQQGFIVMVLVYCYTHYFFASITTHVSAMLPAFLSISLALGTPPMLAGLVFAFASSLQSCLTHYGTSSGAVYFSSNFVPIAKWWQIGFAISIVYCVIWGVFGVMWWKILGMW